MTARRSLSTRISSFSVFRVWRRGVILAVETVSRNTRSTLTSRIFACALPDAETRTDWSCRSGESPPSVICRRPGDTSAFASRVTIALSVYTVAFTTREETLASPGFGWAVKVQIGSSVAAARRGVTIRMTMGLFSGGTNVPRHGKTGGRKSARCRLSAFKNAAGKCRKGGRQCQSSPPHCLSLREPSPALWDPAHERDPEAGQSGAHRVIAMAQSLRVVAR